MVAPVHKDSLTEYQQALATYLRITSPFAGMFTGNEIKPNPNSRSIRVPDIRVTTTSSTPRSAASALTTTPVVSSPASGRTASPRSSGAPTR